MRGFNPITDLRPPDPFNEPAGQSTEAIERIRTRLVSTREKTAELVDVIKTKNISFKKDIDKIQELNRRLRKTIPRIPIMRGDAGTTSGDTIEEQFRRGFGLGFGGFARSRQKAPVKSAFPFLDLAIAGLLSARGLKGLGKTTDIGAFNNIKNFTRKNTKPIKIPEIFIPSGATKGGRRTINITELADFLNKLDKKPNVIKPGSATVIPFRRRRTFAPSKEVAKKTDTVFDADASRQTIDVDAVRVSQQNFISRLFSLFDTKKLSKFSKEKGFLSFSKDASKIKPETLTERMSRGFEKVFGKNFDPALSNRGKLVREGNKLLEQEQRNNRFLELFRFLRFKTSPIKGRLNKRITRKILNEDKLEKILRDADSKLFKSGQEADSIAAVVRKVLKEGDIGSANLTKSEKSTFEAFKKYLDDAIEEGIFTQKDVGELRKFLRQSDVGGENINFEKVLEQLRKNVFGNTFFETGAPGAFLNVKPMSNDIAMLNTNTGFTRETVIITDSIG